MIYTKSDLEHTSSEGLRSILKRLTGKSQEKGLTKQSMKTRILSLQKKK